MGKECDGAVGADEVGDASIDLREGDSEGVYEEQGERVGGLSFRFARSTFNDREAFRLRAPWIEKVAQLPTPCPAN